MRIIIGIGHPKEAHFWKNIINNSMNDGYEGDKYGLLFYPDQALEEAISILEDKNSKNEWRKRRERLLSDKIDVTVWMTDFIERYPESFYEYKKKI